MKNNDMPYLIEAVELEARLGDDHLLIVDVSRPETYLRGHVPGAIHLNYTALILGQPPAIGLLPTSQKIEEVLSSIGWTAEKHVVAYDDQGNGNAARLLWTLEAVGHSCASLLNGGSQAWTHEGHAVECTPNIAQMSVASVELNPAVVADKDDVLASLTDEGTVLLDARTPEEYYGMKSPSLRNGRIPGALHLNWIDTIDLGNNLRFKPKEELNLMLAKRGIVREKKVITYCQTHHRSSHSFVMFRYLGFVNVRGYAGAWAEWGNDPNLPIE